MKNRRRDTPIFSVYLNFVFRKIGIILFYRKELDIASFFKQKAMLLSSLASDYQDALRTPGISTLVSQLAEADTADAVVTQISMRTAADLAAIVLTGRELSRHACCLRIIDFFAIVSSSLVLTNGAPMSLSSSRASSSVCAVVVIAMFIPRSFSILS